MDIKFLHFLLKCTISIPQIWSFLMGRSKLPTRKTCFRSSFQYIRSHWQKGNAPSPLFHFDRALYFNQKVPKHDAIVVVYFCLSVKLIILKHGYNFIAILIHFHHFLIVLELKVKSILIMFLYLFIGHDGTNF